MGRTVLPQRRRKRGARPQPKHRIDGSFKVSKVGKYNAQGRRVDGHFFHSDAEATRYCQLRRMEETGKIRQLELQPRYELRVEGKLITTYIADFRYQILNEAGWVQAIIIEDVKGIVLDVYKIKRDFCQALYRIKVHELPAQWVLKYEGLHALELEPLLKELGDVKAARKKARAAKKRAAARAVVDKETEGVASEGS